MLNQTEKRPATTPERRSGWLGVCVLTALGCVLAVVASLDAAAKPDSDGLMIGWLVGACLLACLSVTALIVSERPRRTRTTDTAAGRPRASAHGVSRDLPVSRSSGT